LGDGISMIELLAATLIPLEPFDSQKLETLVRRIPSALVKTEDMEGFQRKTYEFPKMKDKGFKINCTADHYLNSPLPSKTNCTLTLLKESLDARYDEELVEFKDPFTVKSLSNAISYKSFFSNERVYGFGLNNKYHDLFRYEFRCTAEKCSVTMATKPALTN
jgi:hypothetical protein